MFNPKNLSFVSLSWKTNILKTGQYTTYYGLMKEYKKQLYFTDGIGDQSALRMKCGHCDTGDIMLLEYLNR